ncbi:hypothetical protein RUM43_004841 [Polyplax serrata]|uniref:BAH domain-containing protein n=1 Tax=Polyplax serrata TaxID=468196 RepID=A0AAN8SDX4_POLSC
MAPTQATAPVDYPPFPPVGFQLVRDPITGHFLLIPASNLEALQRAILWPNYQPTHSQMIIPPISLQPNSPRLLLETNVSPVDFLTPETIQRHTSQHRILINTCNRKVMGPALIKFEASEDSNTLAVPTMENGGVCTKSQAVALAAGKTLGSFNHVTSGLPENIGSQEASTVSCLSPVVQKPQDQFQPIGSTVLSNPSYTSGPLTGAGNQSTPAVEMKNDGSQTSIAHENKFEVFGRRTDVTSSREEDKETEEVPLRGEPEDDKRAVLREIQKRREMEENLKVKISLVPDVNIKKEMVSPSQVDLSGLELLSNSIEQLMCETKDKKIVVDYIESVDKSMIDVDRKDLFNDACEGAVLLQNLKNGFRTLDNSPYKEDESRKDLGGLGLLCALAEQRFQEEIGKANSKNKEAILDCKDADSYEEAKEDGGDSYKDEDEKQTDVDFRTSCMKEETKDCDFNRNYHNECEYSLKDCDDDVETADDADCEDSEKESQSSKHKTTRRYEESENSFSGRGPGRPKKTKCKKLISSPVHRTSRKSKEMSPPVLEKQTDYPPVDEGDDSEEDPLQSKYKIDVLKPPTLTPSAVLEPSSAPAVRPVPWERLGQDSPRRTIKSEPSPGGSESSRKRKYSDSDDMDSLSLSKRRKVGRPKKHIPVGGTRNAQTETIVIKKPRTKPNYLFHPVQTDGEGSDEEHPTREKRKSPFEKFEDQTDDGTNEDKRKNKTKKIRPKLKAEPKIREWTPASDDINLMDWCKSVADEKEDDDDDEEEEEEDVEESTGRKVRVQKKEEDSKISTEATATNKMKVESKLQSCVLTVDHIKGDNLPMRTLTEMGGLFYAGQLSAIRAPDVYGITIDGERGNRPHIYSREEILKYSILEVRPTVAADLTPGVRCCAYWSEQYRCLYPGTVSAPASPDPELDERFVNVEFDDGDSGRINIEDIRLLPEDYPIVEYDPNPLQSLTKRRRRTSGTSVESHSKERKSIDSMADTEKVDSVARNPPETPNDETKVHKTNGTPETVTFSNSEADRKHLKKRRRDKLKRLQSLAADGKRKHKKHRCSDEHRHHKHHKKHRKHRHKHGMKRDGDVSGVKRELEENGKVEELKNKKVKKKGVKQSGKSPTRKPKKCKERTDSVESKSKIAAFLPARQLWGWSGKGFKRPGAKGRARKEFYKTIQRGKERITVGDCAVFLSTGRPDRPYIGRIESMWESWGTNMIVKVKWFYHPEETVGCPATLEYPGGLFESPHVDENDVQTISHKCEVLPLKEYTAKLGNSPHRYETIYDNNDIYYLAGYYDPTNTTLKMEPGVK